MHKETCGNSRLEIAAKTLMIRASSLINVDDNPGRPSMEILVRSWQDLGKILAKIVRRYCQELQDAMVRSYQESHVSKKTFIVKSYLERKNLKGSHQQSTFLQIYILRH